MIQFALKPFSALCRKVMDECKTILTNYSQVKSMENDKLMIPTIRRGFNCMKLHLIITSFIFGSYDLAFSNIKQFTETLIPLISIISILFGLFRFANFLLEKAISTNRLILSTNVFFVSNIYIIICAMITFAYAPGYTESDKMICLCVCIFWIIHSFNLIPGMLSVKLTLFVISLIILLIIAKPKFGYGFVTIIGHSIGYIVQIYIIWEKYHDECLILNKVEYEKNVNCYLQNQFPEAIFTLDLSFEIINPNEKASKLLKSANKLFFKDFALELKNENGQTLFENLSMNIKLENVQYSKKISESNEFMKIIVSSSSFEIENRKITILIMKDLTEFFKRQEKHISERCQNILLFSAPHEIRSQLNLISGNLEQLEKNYDQSLIKIAKYAAKVMEHKLNLLFDFACIVTDKFSEHMKKFLFKNLVDDSSEIIKVFAEAKQLKFNIKYKTSCPNLISDYERLFSMIIHSGLNAIKYTKEGVIRLKICYNKGFLFAKIKDSGVGMKGPIVELINNYCANPFIDNFILLKNSLTSLENSKFLSGIGTLSSAFICNKLRGSLFINSKENKGTEVIIKIRCKTENPSIEEIEDESCIQESARLSPSFQIMKYSEYTTFNQSAIMLQRENVKKLFIIIVVDDLAFNRMTIINMLRALNLNNTREAENGLKAVEEVQELIEKYDQISIFMDIDMPVMNGIEATSKIKEIDNKGKVKIVMLSAFNSEDLIQESFLAGAIGFYVKPISFKKLKELKDSNFLL